MGRPKKPYTRDSVTRALAHHEVMRALHHVSPPGPGRPKFTVRVTELEDPMVLTLGEAHALAIGLAVGQRHYGGAS